LGLSGKQPGKESEAASIAIEELEGTAKLAMMLCGLPARMLSNARMTDIVAHFDVERED
jgi:3-dehydro-4-phosphotetronate decarboxylase